MSAVTLYGGWGSRLILRPQAEAHGFRLEVDGLPVGEGWLRRMDMGHEDPAGVDVRRIDLAIGDDRWRGQGIGGEALGMLIDFAFLGEAADVLRCVCGHCDERAAHLLRKCGFLAAEGQPSRGYETHYALTRAAYVQLRRPHMPSSSFSLPLSDLHPTQLYIDAGKLRLVREWLGTSSFDPIPVIRQDGDILMIDGHTRAVAALLAGWQAVSVYWDEDDWDMDAFARCRGWCCAEGIDSPADLAKRIIPHGAFQERWLRRCMEG